MFLKSKTNVEVYQLFLLSGLRKKKLILFFKLFNMNDENNICEVNN